MDTKQRRFIPALAGNMKADQPTLNLWPVHPRARGEHGSFHAGAGSINGSSPRSRGTCAYYALGFLSDRFIPALAGNMVKGLVAVQTLFGSSPRSRGTLRNPPRDGDQGRFIPALAGNIRARQTLPSIDAVHPRARGEHTNAPPIVPLTVGSSPRSRGT